MSVGMIAINTHNGQASDYQQKPNGRKPAGVPMDGFIRGGMSLFLMKQNLQKRQRKLLQILTASSHTCRRSFLPQSALTASTTPQEMSGNGLPIGINPIPIQTRPTFKQAVDDKQKALRGGSWLEVRDGTAERYFRCANRLHAPPDYAAGNIGFRCVREVPPEQVTESVHVPIEPLVDYVKQRKLSNLRLLQKRTEKNSLKDTLIAVLLISGAVYGIAMRPELVLGGITAGIIGVGFLFSAGVNFWRRWCAVKRKKEIHAEKT